ncbi:MAG: cell division protein FtsZ [Alphaproteobacteria bacterium]|nr:cell division protein FtsZ [Alphaproteobacteria bacterium]MCD8525623.1 cell division protein FtsZ [Alphaproteobacteria bacterium]MCD8569997.1 cell division protein FtsZ [Alphaproteobacteria bacterium]
MQQTQNVSELSPKIIVIGVGGAGGNAVNNMIEEGLEGCEFLVCNTDAQALKHSACQNRVQLGTHVTGGLGAGSKPDVGKAAAEESLEEVMSHLEGANMAFVTAGMGGGTGTGAAPVIARACRERGILTVGVVTKPFHFEGTHRMKMAESGLEEMQDYVDTLIVIPNQNLFRIANEKTTFAEAFKMADSVLQSGVRGVTDLMVRPGLVNLDFADIKTAMQEMGKAMMGTGESAGEKRAIEAAEAAVNNPLLDDVSMKGARGVIINVTGGYDMTLFEADEACNKIRDEIDPNANVIFGATFDESMEGKMRVSIVATGIDRESELRRRDGRSNTGVKMERATPNVSSPTTTPPSGGGGPSGGIPAPVPSSMAVRSDVSASVMSSVKKADEPEADMFEQHGYVTASDAGAEGMPQNTALEESLRGTRYKDAFIPPKPAMPTSYEKFEQPQTVIPPYGTPSSIAPVGSSLQLNPPKMPQPSEKKRTPSLFERITGTVSHTLDSALGHKESSAPVAAAPVQEAAPQPQPQPYQPMPAAYRPSVHAPAQGALAIDVPATKPAAVSESDLDIPAFLRRQAN